MGLPQININFKAKAATLMTRSALGIVALILRETTNTGNVVTLRKLSELNPSDWSAENKRYIELTFKGAPSKVIVVRLEDSEDISEAFTLLNSVKFNYLAAPVATPEEAKDIVAWVKLSRTEKYKKIKAVLANESANDIGIINFTTDNIVTEDNTYTAQEYTARIAGALAGLPFTRSATFYELPEVTAIKEHDTPDDDIDNGELILINDSGKVKIGRAVNSLKTLAENQKEDWKKIKIVDVMDMIHDDLFEEFKNNYVGKVPNTTDNQMLLVAAFKSYLKRLAGQAILDPYHNNTAEIDVDAQRAAWENSGMDMEGLDDDQIRQKPFRSNVFLGGNVKITDAIEDLDFNFITE